MKHLKTLLLTIIVSSSLFAQQHDNIWFVGHEFSNGFSAKLDFNINPVTADSFKRNMPMFRTNTSVCDSLGNLQFYTNGIWIHNPQHQMMQNGDSLNPGTYANNNREYGYVVPEGTIVVPHPKQTNKYYLFHQSYEQNLANAGFGENLYYTLVDMNANGGLGRVEKKNQFLVSDSICYGQLEVVKHGNGQDWWLIQPMAASNGYYTFLITADTIILASKQYIGNANRVIKYEWLGQATFTPNGSKYLRFDHKNDLDIYDFDRCNGLLSNYLHIPVIDSVDNIQFSSIASGIAISPSNQYAYVSSFLNLYQFDLWAMDISASKNLVAVYDSFTDFLQTTFSYLQLAPNNKIYIHAYSTRYLHVINSPDVGGISCNVQQHSIFIHYYNGGFIPNFPHYRTPALAGSPCDTLTVVSTKAEKQEEWEVKLYPNPTSNILTIESDLILDKQTKLVVYNSIGQLIQVKTIENEANKISIQTDELANGLYIVELKQKDRKVLKTFVVLRQ